MARTNRSSRSSSARSKSLDFEVPGMDSFEGGQQRGGVGANNRSGSRLSKSTRQGMLSTSEKRSIAGQMGGRSRGQQFQGGFNEDVERAGTGRSRTGSTTRSIFAVVPEWPPQIVLREVDRNYQLSDGEYERLGDAKHAILERIAEKTAQLSEVRRHIYEIGTADLEQEFGVSSRAGKGRIGGSSSQGGRNRRVA